MIWWFLLGLAVIALSWRYQWWRQSVGYEHPRILMYHMVSAHRPGAKFNKLRVPQAEFERQIEYLATHGWRFAHVSELSGPLPPKTVVLTFDDGYRDNLLQAHPVLARYDAKATLYLVVDRFDRDWSAAKKAHHNTGELMREEKLSDAEIKDLLDSGLWELGAHTLTHANLLNTPEVDKRREITESRKALADQFATDIPSFAYPFGLYGPDDVVLAQQAGYAFAVTTNEGIDLYPYSAPLELKRIKVSGTEGLASFRLRLRTGRRK